MQFSNPRYENEEVTYEDVFLFQNYFDGNSRLHDTSIIPESPIGTSIPIVSANMNAVTGKRLAETLTRYGGLGILPQDMDLSVMKRIVTSIKQAHIQFDTPITVTLENTVRDALGILYKRSHLCVIGVDEINRPIGIFKEKDLLEIDQFTRLRELRKPPLITARETISGEDAYNLMEQEGISSLPIVNEEGILLGILTKTNVVRGGIYSPNIGSDGKLAVAVALGINNFQEKARAMIDMGVEIFVLDTAHGYQKNMIEAIKSFRKEFGPHPTLIAGNVITTEATSALIKAGANGIKVGIGPGAMCTTRMKTGVGRPQFSAVYHCSKEARKLGGFVWADGGIREPRDVCLALAAGASHVMIGSLFAGTYESTGDIYYDTNGVMYKENYGMASGKAVNLRTNKLSPFEQAKRALFQEGISTSRIYLKKGRESVGDIIDDCMTGLRSSMTYIGAKNLKEFHEKAVIGVQTNAGFHEGTPHGKIM
ncbi:inosine 5-monophosphate dehydrogenase [Candidatus Gracilibacteria bacterium CG2_30_37_12]|nr:MAG: inosine 5-monophosphate dehydrogenase [Candidatus Gracilibacteria bacterium CG2_30_37_12]